MNEPAPRESQRSIPASLKQAEALRMRRAGFLYRHIAKRLGVSVATARTLTARALANEDTARVWHDFPPRLARALKSSGIVTRDDLRDAYRNGTLESLPGVGPKGLQLLSEWLQEDRK